MARIAFVFPGQGSQYVGMGKNLAENFSEAAKILEIAKQTLDFDLPQLCFNGPEEELQKTANTQPAILTISTICCNLLKEKGIQPEIVAGHSLGEYSALVASGVLDFTMALKLVRLRGQLMQEFAAEGMGGMAAILGLDKEKTQVACLESDGVVEPVNYNCPGQIVIAGENKALDQAIKLAKEKGAKRAVRLAVSGPFHSSLMQPVSEKLALALEKISFTEAVVPVVSNVTADCLTEPEQIKNSLIKQVYSPVQWEQSITKILEQGIDTFIEVGPGKVLSGLIKKIAKGTTILNVEDSDSLHKVLNYLKEVQ